jgi:FAD/FMN-containing dehydrogenase
MSNSFPFYAKRLLQTLFGLISVILIGITLLFFIVSSPPEQVEYADNEINDVTQLNAILVDQIIRPKSVDEITSRIKDHKGEVSIGGARHSMGGQIGTEHSLHFDMRSFDKIISFNEEEKEITVQTGITWRKIQEHIDRYDLSVMIMQTYADFTVGGSLSVNVHGRYIGYGPLIHSVKSIKIVLEDGQLIVASSVENKELFYGCIGGYGGLGVIIEATLMLVENTKVERQTQMMASTNYLNFFKSQIRNDSTVVFHNGDIYPDDYTEIRAVSYLKTNRSVTVSDRLRPIHQNHRIERFAMWLVSEAPYGKWLRKNWVDPLFYKKTKVEWRNYEASYDAMELEPTSRKNTTYALQEYFIPIDRFDSFVPQMTDVFKQNDVNVINISVRHAKSDTVSLLSWAQNEIFCFVIYYKQGTKDEDKSNVGLWTRKLIDISISEGGSYYLPYQIHATEEQFMKAYPRHDEFFALKKRIDPNNKFMNKLWDAYYRN